jgi:hypothetical protein
MRLDAVNPLNDSHTFTVTLQFDYGDGRGFVAPPWNYWIYPRHSTGRWFHRFRDLQHCRYRHEW